MSPRQLEGDRAKEVLLVEHNNADVCLIRLAFDKTFAWYNLHVAADADEAVRHLYDSPRGPSACPDLIILNLDLPRRNAHDLLQRIKSDPVTGVSPVVVMSSRASESEIHRAYDLQASCYVPKAVNVEDFYRALTTLATFWLTVVELPSCQ